MALDAVIAAVADVLTGLGLADAVLTEPPAKLPDDRVYVVYADPGTATLAAHRGRGSGTVYQADDDVIVNWFRRTARDAMTEAYPETLTVHQATLDALFAGVKNGALNGAIVGFSGIDTQVFGPMELWQADTAFGFQLGVSVRHMTETA